MKHFVAILLTTLALVGCVKPATRGEDVTFVRPIESPGAAMQIVANDEAAVARGTAGALEWSQLSADYLRVSKRTADDSYAQKAEQAARKSLAIRSKNNVIAELRLARSILEQHRFADAIAVTEEAFRVDPGDVSAHELHAELLTELGKYDAAWEEVAKYPMAGLGAMALKARLSEIDGRTDAAAANLKTACEQADKNWDMAGDANAWFHLKYGNLLWGTGKLDQAEHEFKRGIELNPQDFKCMAALARLYAAQGKFSDAQKMALDSTKIAPTVETASLLEDLAARDNNRDDATKYATLVDKVSHPDLYRFLNDPSQGAPSTKPHTHDRLYATYLADHARNLPDALAAAQKDMESRQDIYAFDTLAWVLHQMGRDAEAEPLMAKAMVRGTRDAKMMFHAGMIQSALGHVTEAKAELEGALKLNPAFQYGQVDQAKAELAKLNAAPAH